MMRRFMQIVESAGQGDDGDFDRDDPQQLQQAIERTIAQVKAYAKRLGVRAEFREQPFGVRSEIELTDLYARQPGKGAGTKIMTLLGKLCDQHGLNLYAKPESPRNVEFYARFGFKRSQRHFGMLVRYPPLDLDESAQPEPLPLSVGDAETVAKLIGHHVHVGSIDDEDMQRVMQILPRPDASMKLWRVLAITPEQAEMLRSGVPVPLNERPFQSWTKDTAYIPRIAAMTRSTQRGEIVVVEEVAEPARIVIDVLAFYDMLVRHEEYHHIDTYELRRYGLGEGEVIVHHPTRLVLTADNTRFWQPDHRRPRVGEQAYRRWDTDGDSGSEITEVPDEQPDSEYGFWTVVTTNDEFVVHWTGSDWEEVE